VVINGAHAADGAAVIVKHLLNDVRSDPKTRHACGQRTGGDEARYAAKVKRTSGLGVAAVEVRYHQVQIIRITLRANAVFHALVS
jgi:hypothetical protein